MFVQDRSGQRVPIRDPSGRVLRGEGWPFVPLFGEWQVDGSDFVFTIVDNALIEEIASQFDYVLLSGLQNLGDPLLNIRDSAGRDVNGRARRLIQRALQRQLHLLAPRGVQLHLEVSGFSRPQIAGWIQELIQGAVKSAGINQEELEQITGDPACVGSPFFLVDRPGKNDPPEPFIRRYERARRLAQAFDLDELYVHGNDADLILARGVPRGAIWQELMADLFAKGVVVLALLERSLPNTWQSIAANLSIVLKKDGFLALLALADKMARECFPNQADEQAAVLRDIAFTGYWFNRDPEGYSVIVVPVMWPELPSDLSTAGAGDAVSAAFTILGRK